MNSHWSIYLNEEEKKIYQQILSWEESPGRGFENFRSFTGPLNDYIRNISPEIQSQVLIIVRSALKSLRDYSHYTIYPSSILEKISLKGNRRLESIGEIKNVSITSLDKAATECISFNRSIAAAEGGFTGMMGFQGLLLDLPFLYGVMFRIIEEVSLCYGYRTDTPEERFHMLTTLETSHITDRQGRDDAFLRLASLQLSIRGSVSVSQRTISAALMSISERLGALILRRRLALILKIAGGVTGGFFNYLMAQHVADNAFNIYRKRFLNDRVEERRAENA